MGFRYSRSIRVGKATRINLSKSGVGVSAGVKGARFGVGPRGMRTTVSVPGTGFSYTSQSGSGAQRSTKGSAPMPSNKPVGQPAPQVQYVVYERPRPRIAKGFLVLLLSGPIGLIIFGMGQTVWGALWRGWLFSAIILVVLSQLL